MSYETKTIADVIEDINQKIMLPSIQRKYIWEEKQITKLMDSIMRGYPFGTFLFWKVKKQVVNDQNYPMYEFIKEYHERDNAINKHIGLPFTITDDNKNDTVYAVLDGQQRLTSLYIALKGSLSKKIPKKRVSNDDAYPKKELYFNLLSEKVDEDDDILYEFEFFTEEAIKSWSDESKLWYKVKDILRYPTGEDVLNEVAMENGWIGNRVIVANLSRLFRCLKADELINYFEIKRDSMDEVLDIFVRVNSGGTVLSKTDLLFSTIVANWQGARDEIDEFLKSVNKTHRGYHFDSDFIMRACLYTLDMSTLMKVENFKKENIEQIRENWPEIKMSIKESIALLDRLGFYADNIISSNAILPIIYYRFKTGKNAFENCLDDVRKYFVASQLKKVFAAATSRTLDALRNEIRRTGLFSYADMKKLTLANDSSLACDESTIDEWLDNFKKGSYTFLLLSLLYPDLKFDQHTYEQDHLHPYTSLKSEALRGIVLKNGKALSEQEIADWVDKRDTLPNLGLLTDKENESKSGKTLAEWIESGHRDKYLPTGDVDDYNLRDFIHFYEERRKILKDKLKEIIID